MRNSKLFVYQISSFFFSFPTRLFDAIWTPKYRHNLYSYIFLMFDDDYDDVDDDDEMKKGTEGTR